MEHKGFFTSLFDFSFQEFVTTRIVQAVYLLAIVVSFLVALGTFWSLMQTGFFGFVAALVAAPITFLAHVVIARIGLEVILVLFRIAENTQKLADAKTDEG